MTDLLGPGDAGAARAASTTSDVSSPLAGDTWQVDCTGGVAGTGTPIVAKFVNRLLQQMRRLIRNCGISLNNADDDMLSRAVQSGAMNWAGTLGGTANALTGAIVPAPAALSAGLEVVGEVTAPNTGASTFALGAISPAPVIYEDGSALTGGELYGLVKFKCDGAAFRIDKRRATERFIFSGGQSGTFNTPSGARRLIVRGIGGGGSGSANTVSGNNGGDTTFGPCTGHGGHGAVAGSDTPGIGGLSSGADIGWFGATAGVVYYPTASVYGGGCGGAGGGPLAGAPGAFVGDPSGKDGLGGDIGAGGSGAAVISGTYPGQGGGGAGSFESYFVGPAASYSYSIGTGGALVTSTHASGAGGGGQLVIEVEF